MKISHNPLASYHVHVYYDKQTREIASSLRRDCIAYYNTLYIDSVGNMHDTPVGPHTKPMFRIALKGNHFHAIINYLMLNRQSLSILVHPETDNDLLDHTERALWLGTPVALDLSKL